MKRLIDDEKIFIRYRFDKNKRAKIIFSPEKDIECFEFSNHFDQSYE